MVAAARSQVRRLAVARVVLDLVGARVALRHGLAGEPLGVRMPPSVPTPLVLVGWGTAVSGPWAVTAAHVVLAAGDDTPPTRRATRALAGLGLLGVLSEPATWGRRHPRWTVVLSAAHVLVAVGFLRATRAGREPDQA